MLNNKAVRNACGSSAWMDPDHCHYRQGATLTHNGCMHRVPASRHLLTDVEVSLTCLYMREESKYYVV